MKTIESRGARTEKKLGMITFVVGFTFVNGIYTLLMTETIVMGDLFIVLFGIIGNILVIGGTFMVTANRRDLIFTDENITLKEYHYLLGSLMPKRTVNFTWDDVIAWDENRFPMDMAGKDPYTIDLLFQEGDENKLYRAAGSWIFIDKKRIRFNEFKELLEPFLKKIPRDEALLTKYDKNLPIAAYASLVFGILLIGGSIMGMVLASMGNPAPGMTVIAGLFGLALLKASHQLFKDKEKAEK